MAAFLPATTAPEPEVDAATSLKPQVDAVLDRRLDLRKLAESSTSFGSYVLRWQLFESARRRNAVL